MIDNEIWKDINGYEGYYKVSNHGRIKSIGRYVMRKDGVSHFVKEKFIKPVINSDGYYQFKLCKDGKYTTKRVHQVVAEAFCEKPIDFENGKYEVNHKDCNRTNNNCYNLEWITHGDNVRYSISNGNHFCTRDISGKNNPNYGNHKLSIIYRENPRLAKEKLARPNSQNGRAVKIKLYDSDKQLIGIFDWIGGCAEYLIKTTNTESNINSMRSGITNAIKKQTKYLNHYYEKVND